MPDVRSMARPRLNEDKKLSKRFIFRLTENELKLLHGVAAMSGKKPAIVVREKLFTGKYPQPKMPRIDLQTYLELKKIGVNLNQMAKKANSNMLPYGTGKQLKELLDQQQTLINLLLNDSQSEDR
jgi:hypothetical protein